MGGGAAGAEICPEGTSGDPLTGVTQGAVDDVCDAVEKAADKASKTVEETTKTVEKTTKVVEDTAKQLTKKASGAVAGTTKKVVRAVDEAVSPTTSSPDRTEAAATGSPSDRSSRLGRGRSSRTARAGGERNKTSRDKAARSRTKPADKGGNDNVIVAQAGNEVAGPAVAGTRIRADVPQPPAPQGGRLALTGFNLLVLLVVALFDLGAGTVALFVSRKRQMAARVLPEAAPS
jgi:cobalamin biosynthesis Mg chelatase CobN